LNGKNHYQRIGKTTEMSLADARTKAMALKAEIANNPDFGKKIEPKRMPTFGEVFLDRYLPHAQNHKKSWKKDLEYFELRLQPTFGNLAMDKIERSDIQQFHDNLKHQGLSAATSNHYVKLLKHVFNLAIDWGIVNSNPAVRISLFHEDNQIERYLTEPELARLMAVLTTDENRMVCAILQLLLATGARLGEALQARWEHVNVEKRLWKIPAQNSKSKRVRSVPLNDSAIAVLSQLETQEYLFVNRLTGLPYTTITKVWERIRLKANLSNLRIHDLRHQFASFLVNNGRSLYDVQMILGHSSPVVTQRYAHLSTKSLQEAANSASVQIQAAIGN
jgi:site-specific recombinase XerD